MVGCRVGCGRGHSPRTQCLRRLTGHGLSLALAYELPTGWWLSLQPNKALQEHHPASCAALHLGASFDTLETARVDSGLFAHSTRDSQRSRMLGRTCTTFVYQSPLRSRHYWIWLGESAPAWSVKDQLAGLATAQPPPVLDLRCAVMAHQLQHQVRGGSALPRTDCGSGRDKENGCSPWACHGPSASRCRHIRIVRSSQPILSALTSANADVSHRSGDTLPVYQS